MPSLKVPDNRPGVESTTRVGLAYQCNVEKGTHLVPILGIRLDFPAVVKALSEVDVLLIAVVLGVEALSV